MDTRTQNVINSNRQLIIDDLHSDVFDDLLDKGVLSQEEHSDIMILNNQEKKNGKLLEILVNKNDGLEKLMEALKEWYWWIEQSLKESLEQHKSLWKSTIAHTNIPPISNRNVSRMKLLDEVRSALKSLNNGHYVILHGMSGCGKSSLAAEALHDDILTTCFEGKVHWLKCGQEMSDSEDEQHMILGLQIELNERICNEELVVSDVKKDSTNIVRTKLMKRLESSEFKKGLIVLDGVNSPQVLAALNIGCKTLITTTDLSVSANLGNRSSSIKVDEGFTEKESLELLAKCVDLPIAELPAQALQIHKHSKGHPLMMSLIGGQIETHQEELKLHKEKWNPYVEVLHNKDYENLKRRSVDGDSFSTKKKTIELCINSLSPEMKEKYQDFALFVEDVNIKTKVLEILWKLPEQEVRGIMDDFYRKSLIVRKFNTTQNSYVYGIHDLLLYHIKKQLDDNKLQELHLKLIRRYEEYCKGNLSKLPRDDNYFFYYIGYHIANAKLYEQFAQWYFDLDFIEGKLKAAGPGDLLLDYKRYAPHFIEGSKFDESKIRSKLSDFERFVELSGYDVKRDNKLDIVQLALQEPLASEVYRTALRCVGSRPHNTYLHFQLGPSKSRSAPRNISVKEKISCACFSKDSSDLIVAYESGLIQIMKVNYFKSNPLRYYKGHSKSVKMLSVFAEKNIFLSVAEDCVKIWKLPDLESASSEPEARTPSPSQTQLDFTDMFNKKTDESGASWHTLESFKGPIVWACFSSDGTKIATCSTEGGKVVVWGFNVKECFIMKRLQYKATACIFSHNDEFLIIGCSSSYISIHNIKHDVLHNQFPVSYPTFSLFTLPDVIISLSSGDKVGENFGVLTKKMLCVWELKNAAEHSNEPTKPPYFLRYNSGENENFVCCAAASDGSIVAVAKSNGRIDICDLSDGRRLGEINDSSSDIKYLAMRAGQEPLLLGSCSETLKLWTLDAVLTGKQAIMKPNFAVAWNNKNEPVLVAPTSQNYCIKSVSEKAEPEHLMVEADSVTDLCAISRCGRYVVASTKNNQVYLHQDGTFNLNMFNILNTNKEPIRRLKIQVLQGHIVVAVGCRQFITVWMKKEEASINESTKVNISLKQDRVKDFYILSREELVVISLSGSVQKWSLKTTEPVQTLGAARLDVSVCQTELNGNNLVVLTRQSTSVRAAKWFLHSYNLDTENPSEPKSVELKREPTCCSFSDDGRRLAVGFRNGTVQVYSCEGWSVARDLELDSAGAEIVSVCMSTQGQVWAATESRVILHTVTGGQGRAKLSVKRVVMSPGNTTIITVDIHGHLHLISHLNSSQSSSTPTRGKAKPKKHSLSLP